MVNNTHCVEYARTQIFSPYTEIYGSEKTRILAYSTQ